MNSDNKALWRTSKDQLVTDLLAPREDGRGSSIRAINSSVRGNILFVLFQNGNNLPTSDDIPTWQEVGAPWIEIFVLKKFRGSAWSFTGYTEATVSAIFNCPLKFLVGAPSINEIWRQGVHAYHNVRRTNTTSPLQVGDKILVTLESGMLDAELVSKAGYGWNVKAFLPDGTFAEIKVKSKQITRF